MVEHSIEERIGRIVKKSLLQELISMQDESDFPVSAIRLNGRVYNNRLKFGLSDYMHFSAVLDSYQTLVADGILFSPDSEHGVRFAKGNLASK